MAPNSPEKAAEDSEVVERPASPKTSALSGVENAAPVSHPLFTELPKGGRRIGDTRPMALEALSPAANWVAYCTPTNTSQTSMVLTERGMPTQETSVWLQIGDAKEEIDALLAFDPTGRYLVILQQQVIWLVDAQKEQRVDLSPLKPDLVSDQLPGDHRAFAFAPEGLAVLSASRNSGFFIGLSPDLSLNGADLRLLAQPISFGAKWIWRLNSEVASISATVVPHYDSNSWPVPKANGKFPERPERRCASRSGPFAAYDRISSFRPDAKLQRLWLESSKYDQESAASSNTPRKTLEAQPAPGFVMGFRDSWLRRMDTGRLMLVKGQTQQQVSSSRCGARVVNRHPITQTFLVSCEGYEPVSPVRRKSEKQIVPRYRFDLNLVRPGFVRALQIEIARTGIDAQSTTHAALFPVRPGADSGLVDFHNQTFWPLDGAPLILATSDSSALLQRQNTYALWKDGAEQSLQLKTPLFPTVIQAGSTVSIGSEVLRLAPEFTRWTLPAPPLALTAEGAALVPQNEAPPNAWPPGPFVLFGPEAR